MFTNEVWEKLVDMISSTFRMESDERSRLYRNRVAKLIACISYVAGCEEPERSALSNLGTYLIAKDPFCKPSFVHNQGDNIDILSRIDHMANFRGGVQDIIDRGIKLLALIQLEDHKNDQAEDKKNGKYNPIQSGAWNYEKQRKVLISTISKVPCPEMDAIYSPIDVEGFWDGN